MLILMRFPYQMECNSLYQVIKEPTRVTSHSATLLDLIITNYPGYFVFSDVLSPPSGCDHRRTGRGGRGGSCPPKQIEKSKSRANLNISRANFHISRAKSGKIKRSPK